ncbi:hypothetical protein GUY60_34530 [Streptomyces sp. YC537]|uniref:PASTA domain-containing protein n=2 Tax=Streptomyces boluensis TaxID=1775135 RepID=A0A964UXP8_9ACTN|nr:hypothetical protein [Streptomyces boluensis]
MVRGCGARECASRGRIALTAGAVLAATALSVTTAVAAGAAGPPMPELTGKPLMNAFRVLDYRTQVEVHDVSGDKRHVLWPGNWKVCEQKPEVGADLAGKPVTLGVVKNAEKCPAA